MVGVEPCSHQQFPKRITVVMLEHQFRLIPTRTLQPRQINRYGFRLGECCSGSSLTLELTPQNFSFIYLLYGAIEESQSLQFFDSAHGCNHKCRIFPRIVTLPRELGIAMGNGDSSLCNSP